MSPLHTVAVIAAWWECQHCGLPNGPNTSRCQLCGSPRPR